jgi:uncharacterized membrane protein YbaN (DUF454 family)
MKWLFLALGSITVFIGLLMLLLPIPLGLPLLVVGVPLVMRYSTRMRDWILNITERFPGIHDTLSRIPQAPGKDQD